MGIVVITMPGEAKRAFVNTLHTKTGESVDLVIVQRSATDSRTIRLKQLASMDFAHEIRESWYSLLLRLSPDLQKRLAYFRETSRISAEKPFAPKTLMVDLINSDEVFDAGERDCLCGRRAVSGARGLLRQFVE